MVGAAACAVGCCTASFALRRKPDLSDTLAAIACWFTVILVLVAVSQ
jgi:hypothetical protein